MQVYTLFVILHTSLVLTLLYWRCKFTVAKLITIQIPHFTNQIVSLFFKASYRKKKCTNKSCRSVDLNIYIFLHVQFCFVMTCANFKDFINSIWASRKLRRLKLTGILQNRTCITTSKVDPPTLNFIEIRQLIFQIKYADRHTVLIIR